MPKNLLSKSLLQRVATQAIERKMIEQRFIETDKEMKRLLQEAELSNRQLAKLSKIDELTSLPNRTHFEEVLHRTLHAAERANKSLGVLYFDLNGFKMINDTFGHSTGDLVLVAVATKVRKALRKSDFFARVHGDEFLILTDLLEDSVQSYSVAKKISTILQSPIRVRGHEVYVSASVGIATFPEISTPEALVDCADQAMYEAKRNRSHFACFYSKRLERRSAERRNLETAFKQALENNELTAEFQQIVGSSAGVAGLEVFCRWTHPELGSVTPSTFVPIAESLNSTNQISSQMLALVAEASKTLFASSQNFFSVNLSSKQARSMDFATTTAELVTSLGVDANRLCFEISEVDVDIDCKPALNRLREHGFKIALSNYGAGPASMRLIPELPVDYVKLDRALVMQIDTSPTHQTICENIIRLAHTLGIEVVAEGVEAESQQSVLESLGCDHYQGYFMGAPFSLPR